MESLMDYLTQFVLAHQSWSYYIVALGIILQGEITFLVAMYLVINHSLDFWYVFLSAFCGVFVSDYFLYFLGKKLRNTKFGWRLYRKIKEDKKTQFYSYYVSQNLKKVIILSKFLIGTNIIVLLTIGWTKVKFGRFFKAHLESLFIWFLVMFTVSYFLAGGAYILKAGKIFKQAEIIIIAIFIALIFGEILLKKFINKIIGLEIAAGKIAESIEMNKQEISDKENGKKLPQVRSENLENIFSKKSDNDV